MIKIFENFTDFIKKSQESVTIIVDRFNASGGADYPIRYFYNHQRNRGRKVLFLEFLLKYGNIKLLLTGLLGSRIIINSIRQLLYFRILFFAFIRKDVCIYLHETDWVFNRIKKENKLKFAILIYILKQTKVLCVSKSQKEWLYSTYGIAKTHVVYNTIGDREPPGAKDENMVLMVGSIQARKGVSLFSRVADLSKERKLPFSFVWVGGGNFNDANLYFSKNVEWVGYKENVYVDRILKKCKIFFLSSQDDPFPLSVFEALDNGVKCVSYKNTGSADVLSMIKGCCVFDEYGERDALNAILSANEGAMDIDTAKKYVRVTAGIEAFSGRITDALKK